MRFVRLGRSLPATAILSGRLEDWRHEMIRNSLFALAASLMTLSAFGSTVAVMTAGSGAGTAQIV